MTEPTIITLNYETAAVLVLAVLYFGRAVLLQLSRPTPKDNPIYETSAMRVQVDIYGNRTYIWLVDTNTNHAVRRIGTFSNSQAAKEFVDDFIHGIKVSYYDFV